MNNNKKQLHYSKRRRRLFWMIFLFFFVMLMVIPTTTHNQFIPIEQQQQQQRTITTPIPIIDNIRIQQITNTFHHHNNTGIITITRNNLNTYYNVKWIGPVIVPISSFINPITKQKEEEDIYALEFPLIIHGYYQLPKKGKYILSITSWIVNRSCILLTYNRNYPPNSYCPASYEIREEIFQTFIILISYDISSLIIKKNKSPQQFSTPPILYWRHQTTTICENFIKLPINNPKPLYFFQDYRIINIKQWIGSLVISSPLIISKKRICFIGDSHVRFLYLDFKQVILSRISSFKNLSPIIVKDFFTYQRVAFPFQLEQQLLHENFTKECIVGIFSIGQWSLSNRACSEQKFPSSLVNITEHCIMSLFDFSNDLQNVLIKFRIQYPKFPLIWTSINPCPVNYIENSNPIYRDYRLQPYIKTWNLYIEKIMFKSNISIINMFDILDPISKCSQDSCHYFGSLIHPGIELLIGMLCEGKCVSFMATSENDEIDARMKESQLVVWRGAV